MAESSLIPIGVWLWENYGKTISNKTATSLKSKWDKFKWKVAAEAYRNKVKKLYGTMQIMGMSGPVPIDDIFTDVYLLDTPTAYRRFNIHQLSQMSADPDRPPVAKRANGLRLILETEKRWVLEKDKQVVKEYDRKFFILGKPGAGKTTFLKYLALKAADQVIDKIPIFISLKEWSDSGEDLHTFMAKRFDICGFPDAQPFVEVLLKSGAALVLFDGLDEVNQESGLRDRQIIQMHKFIQKYDRSQCLITCRIAASDYTFEPFVYVELADFTSSQIATFVSNWFRKDGEKDRKTYQRFFAEFSKEENEGLRDLARTPLLLTLLCLVFQATLAFPQRRVEIYEEALDALLKKWDSSRGIKRDEIYRKLSPGHKENLLAFIASDSFKASQYFIPRKELEKRITKYVKNIPPHQTDDTVDGEAILRAIEVQHGILVERARNIYSFSHLTFQEYFTARHAVANSAKGSLAELVQEHCADLRWREVFLLATSLLPDASEFMKSFRHALNGILKRDKELLQLLAWVGDNRAANQLYGSVIRPHLLYIEFHHPQRDHALRNAHSRALERSFTLLRPQCLENALDLAVRLIRQLESTYNVFLGLLLGLALDLALELALKARVDSANLTSARSLVLDLSLDQKTINQSSDSSIYHDTAIDIVSYLGRDLGLDSLVAEVRALSGNEHDQTTRELHKITTLRSILMKDRHISHHQWSFTKQQEDRLANYLNGTGLLRDCLDLACMRPDEKEELEEGLYLPLAPAKL
jgi:hypothetical protein